MKAPETLRPLAPSGCPCSSSNHSPFRQPVDAVPSRLFPSSSAWANPAFPGCPVPRTLEPRRRRSSGLPLPFSPSAVPAMCCRVAPTLSCLPRCRFKRFPGLPRFLTPPAALLMQSSGCPLFCTSGFTGDGAPSRLDSRILRRCRLTDLRVAPNFGPSVSPMTRSSGCPDSRIFRPRLMVSRVTPGLHHPACQRLGFRVSPNLPPLASSAD